MRQIAFCNQKGGVGKSTLAASLAVAAQEAGETVVLLDLDPQGSIDGWANDRLAEAPAVARVSDTQALQLPRILEKLERDGYTLAILDCQGTDSPLLAEVMKAASLCLIPSRPSKVDIRAARPTIRQILAHKTPFWFVLNQCAPAGSRTAEATSGLSMFGEVAPVALVSRADYQDAFAAGMGVTEYAGRGKAAEEIRQLWKLVDRKMKGALCEQAA